MCASWTTTEVAALQAVISRRRGDLLGGMGENGERRKVGVFRVIRALLILVMRECTGLREGTCYKSA